VADKDFDAIIVGAGFAGLYMLHKLRGLGMTAHVFEAGDDVGDVSTDGGVVPRHPCPVDALPAPARW